MYTHMQQNQENPLKEVFGKIYFRPKNGKTLGVQVEQPSKHTTLIQR